MKISLNLASHRYVNRRALNRTLMAIIFCLLLLLIIQFRAYLQGQKQILHYQAEIQQYERQYQDLLGKTPRDITPEQLAAQREELRQAEALLKRDAFLWTQLFDKMERLLPSGVSIGSFNPDYSKKTLVMNGQAKTLADLQKFLDNLYADSFQHVFLRSQGDVEVSDGAGGETTAIGFSIALEGVF